MSPTKLSLAGIIKLFPVRESLVGDIPAGDREIAYLFYSVVTSIGGACTLYSILEQCEGRVGLWSCVRLYWELVGAISPSRPDGRMKVTHFSNPSIHLSISLNRSFFKRIQEGCRARRLCILSHWHTYTPNPCFHTAKKKCRKFETNIPRKGISGPQSQFPHSCVCERIIYSHDGSAFSAGGNMWTDPRNI